METPAGVRARAGVDLAIIGVLADGGLRRSEGAALTWGDVDYIRGRHGPHHHPEGEEPARTIYRGGSRIPETHPALRGGETGCSEG